nr:hypothetical protein [uncultured Desulfobulbus sp.]
MTIEQNAAEARGMAVLAKLRDAVAANKDYENYLGEFSKAMDEADDETQDRLSEARDQLIDATADEAFAAYAVIAARARTLQDGFRLATKVANDAEGGLFFPAAAAHLAEVAALVDQVAKAAESIEANIENLGDSFKKGDVKNLLSESEAIRDTVDGLLNTLNGLFDKVPA